MKLETAAKMHEVYPDRHLNVFVPYGTEDLDYNLTRALICTLRWSETGLVRRFLKELVEVEVDDAATVLYDLQACDYDDYDPETCETRKLVGISAGGEVANRLPALDEIYQPRVLNLLRSARSAEDRLDGLRRVVGNVELTIDDLEVLMHTLEEYERGSLPDGWIFTDDRKACVLIEAKLTRYLDQHQLDRHAETWFGTPCRGDDLVLLRWDRIAEFAEAGTASEDPRTAFLCRQLADYIEILGNAHFNGFRPFDLDGDALLEGLPKLRRLAALLCQSGRERGLPIGARIVDRGTGVRVGFGDPTLVGALGIELQDDQVNFLYTLGEPVDLGPKADEAGMDRVLDESEGGLFNLLEGLELKSSDPIMVRVDRMLRSGGRTAVDRPVYEAELDTSSFAEVLDELRTQHPLPEQRVEQGRFGVLTLQRSLTGDEALSSRETVLAAALEAFSDYVAIARRLTRRFDESPATPDSAEA